MRTKSGEVICRPSCPLWVKSGRGVRLMSALPPKRTWISRAPHRREVDKRLRCLLQFDLGWLVWPGAILAAIRRASSFVSNFAVDRRPGSLSYIDIGQLLTVCVTPDETVRG